MPCCLLRSSGLSFLCHASVTFQVSSPGCGLPRVGTWTFPLPTAALGQQEDGLAQQLPNGPTKGQKSQGWCVCSLC